MDTTPRTKKPVAKKRERDTSSPARVTHPSSLPKPPPSHPTGAPKDGWTDDAPDPNPGLDGFK
jgi:hypothetical protein